MKIKKNNKFKKIDIALLVVILLLTIYRIFLAAKIPLYAQAGADLDDYMMVKYAIKMINFKWLGAFNYLTLAKSSSFSLFLAISYYLNIPYSIFLIICYILAIITLIFALKNLIKNYYYLIIIYLVLLYSPAMFHIENVQKIYRGGLIITFALWVVACAIGLYMRKEEPIKKIIKWSIGLSLTLGFFWFIKEDSIWILPFILGSTLVTIMWLFINKTKIDKFKTRLFLNILPLLFLILINVGYKSINYFLYGEYTITDRTGTYYKEVLHDLLMIKNKRIDEIWITKDSVYKAIEVSPTLKSIKPQIDNMYENSWALVNGEIRGDIIFWTLRGAVNDAKKYENGGKSINDFYKKIHEELSLAFKKGKLKKEDAIYLSDVSKGLIKQDKKYFIEELPKEFETLITYSENEIGLYEATGPFTDIVMMNYVTNSRIVWPNTEATPLNDEMNRESQRYINQANSIVKIYQKVGKAIWYISIIGILILLLKTIIDLFKKEYEFFDISLIILGLIVVIFIMLVGVSWFVSWFGFTKYRYMYNYSCGIIPLIQIIKVLGTYYLLCFIYKVISDIINIYKGVKDEKRRK